MDYFEETKQLEKKADIDNTYRTRHHLMPPAGWMNDPNGLCEFKGAYHVFFQYTPGAASGDGYRGWGHYTSEDMLHWDYKGLAVAPDTPYDKDGAYSGSALTEDGKMYLYYTGNVKEMGEHDYIYSGRGAYVILVESGDGIRMGAKKILLSNSDYPEDYSCHVRDPKVWKEGDNYYMVLGGRTRQDQGKVLVYCSENRTDWRILSQITTKEPFGYMWECPDIFSLDGIPFLSVSPQGVEAEPYRYQNVYQAGYFGLSGDSPKNYRPDIFTEWDRGFDFYAPQTFEDSKKRRILFGWAGIPDAEYTNRTVGQGWQHCLTLPRVITQREGKLCQNPAEELKKLRGSRTEIEPGKRVETPKVYELCIGKSMPEEEGKPAGGSSIGPVKMTICDGLAFTYDGKKEAVLEFTTGIGDGRTVRRALLSRLENIRMYLDVSVAEIYLNDGEMVFTTRLYPENYTLTIEAEQTLNRMWEL